MWCFYFAFIYAWLIFSTRNFILRNNGHLIVVTVNFWISTSTSRWIWMDFENFAENENKPEIGITYGQGTWHRFSLFFDRELQNETTADFDSQMVIVYNIISWWNRSERKYNLPHHKYSHFFFSSFVSRSIWLNICINIWIVVDIVVVATHLIGFGFDTNENSYSSAMRPWSCLIPIIK